MLVMGRRRRSAKENLDLERRPRFISLSLVKTFSRELIAFLLVALASVMLQACGSATLVLKSPLDDKCKEAGLKKCPELEEAVLAYVGGEKEDSKKKISAIVAANEPQRIQQFADAVEMLSNNLPGLGPMAETVHDIADFLRGEKADSGGAAKATDAPAKIADIAAVSGAAAAAAPSADHSKIEAQARALQKKAMDEDYLTLNFDKATDKLKQAIAKCGADKCAANLRALLRRDLSVIYSASSKKDLALASMVDALKADGAIQLDPNFKTKEIEAIYLEAKKGSGGGGSSAVATGGGTPPAGDFTHTPVDEQVIRTPLPIYVEYGGSEALGKVVVKYKAFGMSDFKTFELKKVGDAWGGTLPCADMLEGDIQYYLQGFSPTNDPVATGGDRNNTYKVSIKKTISSEPPHLPGQAAPKQCAEAADCPPDFPGCKKGGGADLLGAGADCADDGQCKSGSCKDLKCTAPAGDSGGERPPLHRFWIGGGASLDLDFISGANNACLLTAKALPTTPGYYCTVGGADFPSRTSATTNNEIVTSGRNVGDAVTGGMNPGNLRLFLSFDYAVNYNFLIGARAGYGLLSYPGSAAANDGKSFPPIYFEARGTFVLGKDALAKSGFAPVLFLGAGVAQFSSSVPIQVSKCSVAVTDGSCGGTSQTGSFVAWQISGPVFVGPGGGIRYAFTPSAAAILDVKFGLVFGSAFLFAPAPELAVQFGF